MARPVLVILLLLAVGMAPATEPLPLWSETDEGGGLRIELALEHAGGAEATLIARFVPVASGAGWHLYDFDTPEQGIEFAPGMGIGRPTRITVRAGGLEILGRPQISAEPHPYVDPNLGVEYLVYPEGPLTQRYPVRLPQGDGSPRPVELGVWYMLCNAGTCLQASSGRPVTVPLPTSPEGAVAAEPQQTPDRDTRPGAPPTPEPDPAAPGPLWRALAVAALALLAAWGLGLLPRAGRGARGASVPGLLLALAATSGLLLTLAGYAPPGRRGSGIDWRQPHSVEAAEAAIQAAQAEGRAALLDFTGPACPSCLAMAKAHFAKPAVRAAWQSGVPIEIDTDSHSQLAAWQLERFGTQERPLYVRIEPDGRSARWNTFVRDGDESGVARLVAFLDGSATTGGDLAEGWSGGLGGLVLVAILGGLFTLLMPCTYPMIPLTVTFFSKQADGGRSLPPLAACYAGGIVLCFTALGLVVSGLFRVAVSNVAGNPWTNLLIGLLFLAFGLSLLGAFLLRLPSGMVGRLGGGKTGYAGALVMGLTFAVTAFTCTAPVAGLVLGEAMRDGTWVKAGGTMAIYAATIALPFFFLALSPRALHRLPRAGAWMGEFKVVGGLVELGAAFKFLAVADNAWSWELLSRDAVLAIWAACALLSAAYIAGWLRLADDPPLRGLAWSRLLLVLVFATLGAYFAGGVLGMPLAGMIEGLIPYMHDTPVRS